MPEAPRSSGTLYQERQKQPWPDGRDFKILSIDGGGIKGILPAALLAEVERELTGGRRLADTFDMIAGTSTGGIIALGLALGLSAQEVLEIYLSKGGAIFPSVPQPFRRLGRWWGSKARILGNQYDSTALDHEMAKKFGGRRLGDAKCRLVIPAFDHNTEPCIFKTPHHPDYKRDWKEEARVVALATSAAPTYLKGLEVEGRMFWDGGLFANNPIMMAVVDTLACYDVPRRKVKVLSIGCATDKPIMSKKHLTAGQWGWRSAVSIASSLQSHDAVGQARLLVGGDRVLRIDGQTSEPIEMDDYHAAKSALPDVARRLFRENKELLSEFVACPAQPYKGLYI